MLCIFCLTEEPTGNEHVIPEAAGGSFTIERVCESCNNTLGNKSDDPLVKHFLVFARRANLGLGEQARDVADMAEALLGGEAALQDDPSIKVKVTADEVSGVTDIKIKPSVATSREPTGELNVRAVFDPRELSFAEAKLRRSLKDLGCSDVVMKRSLTRCRD